MTKKKIIIAAVGALICGVLIAVWLLGRDMVVGPGDRPSSTIYGTVTEISGDSFKVAADSVDAGEGFTDDNFRSGDSITVRTSGKASIEGRFPNEISSTVYLAKGDKVVITYSESGFDLSGGLITSADISWETDNYSKKREAFFSQND